jgi:hypothetical protein
MSEHEIDPSIVDNERRQSDLRTVRELIRRFEDPEGRMDEPTRVRVFSMLETYNVGTDTPDGSAPPLPDVLRKLESAIESDSEK